MQNVQLVAGQVKLGTTFTYFIYYKFFRAKMQNPSLSRIALLYIKNILKKVSQRNIIPPRRNTSRAVLKVRQGQTILCLCLSCTASEFAMEEE